VPHRRLLVVPLIFTLSGCAMLAGGGKGRSSQAQVSSRFDNEVDEHEQTIDEGKPLGGNNDFYQLWNPADRNSKGEDSEALRKRIQQIDSAWAKKIGNRGQEIAGDGHRTWSEDATLQQAAGKVYQSCPTSYFDASAGDHFYAMGKYAEFDKAVSEALQTSPEALHIFLPRNGQRPLDVLTYTLSCEEHRQRELNRPDGVADTGPGPTDAQSYQKALLLVFPPYPTAPYKELNDRPTVRGCGYKDFRVEEQYMGAGRYGQAELADRGSPVPEPWVPIKCSRLSHPTGRYTRESAQARGSLNHSSPGDYVMIPDSEVWQVERDEYDRIVSRFVNARVFEHNAPLPLFCGTQNPFDACYEGGSWVMLMYEAAKTRLADAARFASANKLVHCRIAAWAAYGLAGEPPRLRDSLRSQASWASDMHYLPKGESPLDENGLMRASEALRGKAKAQFEKCGGQGAPPAGTEWSDALTNANHTLFRWAQ
jgi:hypothetical protein